MLKSQITNSKSQANHNTKRPRLQTKALIFGIVILAFGIVCNLCIVYCNLENVYAEDEGPTREAEILFMAQKAFEDGFYDVSLGLLERFLKNYPDSGKVIEASLLTGECLLHQNKFSAALAKFEELLNDPRAKNIRDSLYYWIAEVNFKGNNFAQAGAYYKKVISEFPASSYALLAYYSLGWSFFQERRFKEALAYFRALAEKYPKEPQSKDAAFKIIECLYGLKDYAALKEKISSGFAMFAKDPLKTAYLYFYLGEADYYLGNFEEASAAYSKALVNNPDDKMQALAKLDLGWSYLKLKRYKDAEDIFWGIKQEALEARSRHILLLGKALLLMETNRVNEAKRLYEELSSASSDPLILAQARIGKADALYNLADYARASEAYQEALDKIDPQYLAGQAIDQLYYKLGCSFLKLPDPSKAINSFRKIVSLDNFDDAAYAIGLAYFKEQDYGQAKEMLKKFQTGFKESGLRPEAIYLLGNCFYNLGDYSLAIQAFSEVPGFPGIGLELIQKAEYGIADSFYQMGNQKEALARFKALRSKYPASQLTPDIIWWLGTYYYQHNEFGLAARYFLSVIQDFPQSLLLADAYYALGLALAGDSKPQEALSYFKKALGSNKPDIKSKAAAAMAELFYQTGDYENALTYYLKGLEKASSKDLPRLRLRIAELNEAKGNPDQAIKEYWEAVKLSGENKGLAVAGLLRLGRIYEDKNNIQEAAKVYSRISRMNIPESKYAEERLANLKFQAS